MVDNPGDNRVARSPDDAKVRGDATDPHRSFIVRAPAGSGKTTLLIQRYLKLLTRVEKPEEILCMTFTRKAAGEMRNRVLAALRCADEETSDGDTTMYHQLACEALVHAHKYNWNLLDNPARLQFHTIDAMCSRLVRQMPQASGFGAAPAIEDYPGVMYRRAADEAIACMDDGDEPAARAARSMLDHLDNNHDRLQSLIVEMLGSRDQWLWLTVQHDARERGTLERAWDEVVTHDLKRVRGAISENAALAAEIVACAIAAATQLHDDGSDSPIVACRDLKDLPLASPDALPQWRGLAQLLLTGNGTLRKGKGVTKRIGFPSGSAEDKAVKQRMVDLLDGLCGETALDGGPGSRVEDLHAVRCLPQPCYDDKQWEILGALLTLLKQAAAQLNLDIGASGRCDFIALSNSARDALGTVDDPTDLALVLDYRIQHILVDEFQDTSQAQMDLLELLTAGWDGSDNRTLFLVGDPMQSIYAFRRADVGIYLRTVQSGIGQFKPESLTLTANFRSQQPLVEWVNRVFGKAMPPSSDELTGAVEFSASTASRDGDADAGVFLHAYHDQDRQDEASALAAIARAERDRDCHATIAILARARLHLPAILRALKAVGVPYQKVGLEPLVERPLVRDLLALTCALLHPSDRTAWLAVLRAPWCGLELRDLELLSASDGNLWERLHDPAVCMGLSCTARERVARVVPVLERALANRGRLVPARWVENTWLHLGGAALTTKEDWPDARLYFDQLRQLCESSGLRDYRELYESLQEVRSVAGSGADAVDAPSNPVQVMSMHGAKGLEFDVVLIPGLARTTKSDEKKLMLWNNHQSAAEKRMRLLIAPLHVPDDNKGDGSTTGDDGAMYEYLRTFLKNKQRLEDARLLYVACTRAKHRLHLFATVKTEKEGRDVLKPPPVGALLSHIWQSCGDDFSAALQSTREDEVAAAAPADRTEQDAQTYLRRVPDGWQLPSPSAAIPLQPDLDDVSDLSDTVPTFDWAGQPARMTGIIVHRMLCLIAEQGLHQWDAKRVRGCRAAWAAELKVWGLERATRARVLDGIEAALCSSLDDPKGRWILDDTHRDARNEYALSGIINGRLVRNLVPDRTMTDGDGVRWIIDYKAGGHRGPDLEGFLDNEQKRYRSQLEGYARLMSCMTDAPIRLGLYFPLVRGWREWAWQGNGEPS